jgi:large subunit ribosomal protein L25
VPAVLYGHGEPPKHIALPVREFAAAIRHGGVNQVFNLSIGDGTETLALTKAIQRDPVKDTFEHVDLVIVRRGERVTVDVPVHLVGEAAKGSLVVIEHDRLSVTAEALHLPETLEVSIEGLEVGSHVTAGAVPLPSGVALSTEPETILAVISPAPTEEQLGATLPVVEEEAPEEAAEGVEAAAEGGEGAEGEAAEEPAEAGV